MMPLNFWVSKSWIKVEGLYGYSRIFGSAAKNSPLDGGFYSTQLSLNLYSNASTKALIDEPFASFNAVSGDFCTS